MVLNVIVLKDFLLLQPVFLDLYLKAVLNAREKPAKSLSEAFHPLFLCLTHEEFGNVVVPSCVKMLKRNPEIALELVEILLKAVSIDLSKYTMEILPVVLAQARHADEGRRLGALAIIRCLSEKSSNPDLIESMFNTVKAIIGGVMLICYAIMDFLLVFGLLLLFFIFLHFLVPFALKIT